MQPKVRGWVLASVDGQSTGLVPANYIKILGKRRGRQTGAGPEGRNEKPKSLLETPAEKAAAAAAESGLQQQGDGARASSALPSTHSELNLAAFDEAFAEGPIRDGSSQATGGTLPVSVETEWSAWEKEQTKAGPSDVLDERGDTETGNS